MESALFRCRQNTAGENNICVCFTAQKDCSKYEDKNSPLFFCGGFNKTGNNLSNRLDNESVSERSRDQENSDNV